jgi:hypothetical protein
MAAELDLQGEIDPPAPATERSGSGNWFGGGGKAFPAVRAAVNKLDWSAIYGYHKLLGFASEI